MYCPAVLSMGGYTKECLALHVVVLLCGISLRLTNHCCFSVADRNVVL